MSGPNDLHSAPRLGAGREAEVYIRDDTTVIKLYRAGFGGHRIEAATLRSLNDNGLAPKLLDVVEHEGRTGLVMERLAGADMLTRLQRQPWLVLGLGHLLAEAHLTIHQAQAPEGLADLRQVLAERIADAGLPRHLRGFVSQVLDQLPDGDRLCHGDYHPGNLILAPGRVAVIDWGAATRGSPEADHARTLLLLRWADPLPDTPPMTRRLIAVGRSLVAATYTRAYRRGAPPLQHTKSWLIVHAAARLSEGITAERSALIARLERASRHTP